MDQVINANLERVHPIKIRVGMKKYVDREVANVELKQVQAIKIRVSIENMWIGRSPMWN